jgi:hypothetical protein
LNNSVSNLLENEKKKKVIYFANKDCFIIINKLTSQELPIHLLHHPPDSRQKLEARSWRKTQHHLVAGADGHHCEYAVS